jgi:hypothetical protein
MRHCAHPLVGCESSLPIAQPRARESCSGFVSTFVQPLARRSLFPASLSDIIAIEKEGLSSIYTEYPIYFKHHPIIMADVDTKEDKDALDALELEAKEFDKVRHALPINSSALLLTS